MTDIATSSGKPSASGLSFLDWLWCRLPDYKSLAGYLERRSVIRVGRLHIRLHKLLSEDITPFLHSHPFSYVSVIVRGGYTEQTEAGFRHYPKGSVLFRASTLHHRLDTVIPGTLTLFFTWEREDRDWRLKRPDHMTEPGQWVNFEAGVYLRTLYGRERYCKFGGFWHTAADSIEQAQRSTRPSIDQSTTPKAGYCEKAR